MTTRTLTLSEKKKLVKAAEDITPARFALVAAIRKSADSWLEKPCQHTPPGEKGPAVAGCPLCLKALITSVAVRGFRDGVAVFYRPPKLPPSVIIAESEATDSADAEVSEWRARKLERAGLVRETEPGSCLFVCVRGKTMDDLVAAMPAIADSVMAH